nr:hypothetical protein [Tanacetum cinerariifolium]
MSSASSTVTYTSVYTDSEPERVFWVVDEELSDGGSLQVIVYGYDRLPMQPVAPPSPDYIPSLEEPQTPPLVAPPSPDYIPDPEEPQTPPVSQDEDECEPMFLQPHDLDYVPEPMYPEYIPLEDEHVLPAEEQPLPHVDSPTVESPGYVVESDPEEDPEEYEDDESKDGPVDYPMKRGDDGDDDDGDSSGDEADDELTEGREIDYGFVTLDAKARRRGIGEVGYDIRDTWVDPTELVPEIAPMTLGEDSRTRISQRVTMDSQRVDLLMDDMIAHQETILIVEEEAYAAREAWPHSIGLSQVVHSELQTHREQAEIAELRETDRRRQAQLVETLRVMRDMKREMGDMQA